MLVLSRRSCSHPAGVCHMSLGLPWTIQQCCECGPRTLDHMALCAHTAGASEHMAMCAHMVGASDHIATCAHTAGS